jgi:hypothetical protein
MAVVNKTQRLFENVISSTGILGTFPDMMTRSKNDDDVPGMTVSFPE